MLFFTTRLAIPRHRQAGFTLIELMLTVVIVGILAAIAVPSYDSFVKKSRRSEAKALLTSVQSQLERCYTLNITYTHNAASTPCSVVSSMTSPNVLKSENGFYRITTSGAVATTLAASTYTLRAERQGAQVTDKCGNFTLSNTDTRGIVNQSAGMTVATCW